MIHDQSDVRSGCDDGVQGHNGGTYVWFKTVGDLGHRRSGGSAPFGLSHSSSLRAILPHEATRCAYVHQIVWRCIINEQNDSNQQERLRPSPVERFAGESHVFDLGALVRQLRAEAVSTKRGHRQMTIFQRTPVTKVLFAFEAGSELQNHTAHGLVTIHVLEGTLAVQADGQDYTLDAGHILILNPDVLHNVRAAEASAMLLTVHFDG